MAKVKKKKSLLRRWWFWVIIVAVLFYSASSSIQKTSPDEVLIASPEVVSTPSSDVIPTPAPALTFTLSANAPGEYGRPLTLNDGTEDAYTFYCFYLPAGEYTVRNPADKGGEQITFCRDGTAVNADGIEEVILADQHPIVVMAGEEKTFHLAEGEYIKLSDSASGLMFEKTA